MLPRYPKIITSAPQLPEKLFFPDLQNHLGPRVTKGLYSNSHIRSFFELLDFFLNTQYLQLISYWFIVPNTIYWLLIPRNWPRVTDSKLQLHPLFFITCFPDHHGCILLVLQTPKSAQTGRKHEKKIRGPKEKTAVAPAMFSLRMHYLFVVVVDV